RLIELLLRRSLLDRRQEDAAAARVRARAAAVTGADRTRDRDERRNEFSHVSTPCGCDEIGVGSWALPEVDRAREIVRLRVARGHGGEPVVLLAETEDRAELADRVLDLAL